MTLTLALMIWKNTANIHNTKIKDVFPFALLGIDVVGINVVLFTSVELQDEQEEKNEYIIASK